MATELRLCYSQDYLEHVAMSLSRDTGTSPQDFVSFVTGGSWTDFALKERMSRLTEALLQFLPGPFEEDLEILGRLLPDISTNRFKYSDMLAMFVPEYVVARGQDKLEASLEALSTFTALGTTSELAIRPFIQTHPEKVMEKMLDWSGHQHPHVRRFSSEGCRPRLPWAMALPALKKDPAPILPILERLRRDDSKFVQKSVANNLNDITKDNPDTALAFAEKWIGSHKNSDWIIKHGMRSLLKQGNSRSLALFGSGPVSAKEASLILSHDQISMGSILEFRFRSVLEGPLPETLRIDYAIDFMKSNGKPSRKVFRISEIKEPDTNVAFSKSYRFQDLTTRKHYAGEHRVSVILNGQEVTAAIFTLHM